MKISLTIAEIKAMVAREYVLPDVFDLEIVDTSQEEPDNDWITNIGRNKEGHPDSLDGHFLVEVLFRDKRAVGQADNWISNWKETDNDPNDIVAYRILKD